MPLGSTDLPSRTCGLLLVVNVHNNGVHLVKYAIPLRMRAIQDGENVYPEVVALTQRLCSIGENAVSSAQALYSEYLIHFEL